MRNIVKNSRYFSRSNCLTAALTALPLLFSLTANAEVSSVPLVEQGIQIGDLAPGRAIIWSRSDRAAQMFVKYAIHKCHYNSWPLRDGWH